jgi:immunity protein 53 of polymorphic toxin system
MDRTLYRLSRWFAQHCDGVWENDHGISITSCDNPGWWVKIDLAGTSLAERPFTSVKRGDVATGDPQPPWLPCYVEEHVFNGAGDATTLETILEIFLAWAEE